MKNIKKIGLLTTLILLVSFTVLQISQEKEKIIGAWISEGAPNSKWVFKNDGKCYDYLDGNLDKTYYYSIETTTPQCFEEVPVGELFSYLKVVNIADSNDYYCYEILSLDDYDLQIRWLKRGGSIYFKRQ
ncbi:MAG: hypothetical protein V3V28_01315 [Polaribacter sp.]|uniref:hypothetical protein n=1 Tax=Polaribacter sp. TaxID=1920175 RepID=UPI002F35039C